MSYLDPTYVIFDGDEDKWAYGYMLGWKKNDRVEFDFRNAHDLDSMTGRAQDEEYVKSMLRGRMKQSKQVILLLGEKTKNLYKFVRWELELALELDLPIIVVNLNNQTETDVARCPAILRKSCAVHIPFKLAAIRHALDGWPGEYSRLDSTARALGPRKYSDKKCADWLKD